MSKIFQLGKQILSANLTNKYSYFTISCFDTRLEKKVRSNIAKAAFPKIYNPNQYSYKIPGSDVDAQDKSALSLIKAIESIAENNSEKKENLLLIIHDDCYAAEKNIIDVPKKENGEKDYKSHLKNKILELLKNPQFVEMIKNDILDFKAAIIYHQKDNESFNKAELYSLNYTNYSQDADDLLQFEKEFSVEKSEPEKILFAPFEIENLEKKLDNILAEIEALNWRN